MADLLTDGSVLYRGQPGTEEATLGSAISSGKLFTILEIIFCNTTSSDATITLSVIPSGGAAGDTNRIYNAITIKANSTYPIPHFIPMAAGGFLSGLQGTSGAITITVSGTLVTL